MESVCSELEKMIYAGRGIVAGVTLDGKPFVTYFVTGRSPSSQARKFVQSEKTKVIRTAVTNEEELKTGSPALLLYPAMAYVPEADTIVASNGAQTKLIYSAVKESKGSHLVHGFFTQAFKLPLYEYDQKDDRWIDITTYEPDAPNNTPRITAALTCPSGIGMTSVWCEEGYPRGQIYYKGTERGKGNLLTTYKGGNENPLLPLVDGPKEVEIPYETISDLTENIYNATKGGVPGKDFRVCAATMAKNDGGIETYIINRSDRGE